MDIEGHVTSSADFGWMGMSGTAVEEVFEGFCCCLCVGVDFGGQVIESMHGGAIN